jgi:hypothetical protein
MIIAPAPGLKIDRPPVTFTPIWWYGYNVRFRMGLLETIGLFGPARTAGGARLTLPDAGAPYRKAFTSPSTTTGQILFGSANRVQLVDYDPASTPLTGTRWRQTEVTPAGLSAATDVIPTPSAARIEIPPVWWFSDQEDLVVGGRSNVASDPVYAWDRNSANDFVPLAGSPTGGVGGGILNRILVLLGCTSLTDPDPARSMTIRWSDRFNFEEWTPSDINVSGELQLEGGSRIVGGGPTGFGMVAWTDKRMALLTETFDPNSVFARRYIDGGRGLLANNSWVEADGQVWWFDENRVLNIFDGGRPRQVLNPLKYATIERISDAQIARSYMTSSPEHSEIILHYCEAGSTEPDAQLVYNYADDAWSIWRLRRGCWHPRVGVIPSVAVNDLNEVIFHDLDTGLPSAYITGPALVGPSPPAALSLPTTTLINASDVDPVDFVFGTNIITPESVTRQSKRTTRLAINYVPAPAVGASDSFTAQITGYGKAQVVNVDVNSDWKVFSNGRQSEDFRVGGKALQIAIYGTGVKTVFRFENMDIADAADGTR